MRSISTIFLDDGGVMNDNERRAVEWERLIGEFLAPRLGGDRAAWGEANRVVFDRQWQRFEAWTRERVTAGEWGDFFGSSEERERWLREMCEHVGVGAPAGSACLQLACETDAYVIPRVRAAYPGAVDAIRALHRRGYTISTASSAPSWNLECNLAGMGVRDLFTERLYGPDLVSTLKEHPEFHRRIFADAGVAPADTLVVDDSPQRLRRAAEAGAATVLISAETTRSGGTHTTIVSLADLPSVLKRT